MSASLRESFAQSVRQRRKENGWSQERLAEEAALHRTYISGVERGTRNVSIDNIEKIGRALGADPADLLRSGKEAA